MKLNFSEGARNLAMSGILMLVVAVASVALCSMRSKGRTPDKDVEDAQALVASAQAEVAAVTAAPEMTPLYENWSIANLVFREFEVTVDPKTKMTDSAGAEVRYAGVATHWSAVATGSPERLLAALWRLREAVPLVVNGFSLKAGGQDDANKKTLQVSLSVLGRF